MRDSCWCCSSRICFTRSSLSTHRWKCRWHRPALHHVSATSMDILIHLPLRCILLEVEREATRSIACCSMLLLIISWIPLWISIEANRITTEERSGCSYRIVTKCYVTIWTRLSQLKGDRDTHPVIIARRINPHCLSHYQDILLGRDGLCSSNDLNSLLSICATTLVKLRTVNV